MSQTPKNPGASHSAEHRRGFFFKTSTAVLGAVLAVFPFVAGLAVFLSPLTKKRKEKNPENDQEGYLRVTTIDAIPKDGSPKRFAVITDLDDAWTHYRNVPIGSVYLRLAGGKVEALNTTCPHAGCFVNFDQPAACFKCPCHNSFFKLDGEIIEPSPSPRRMDTLAVTEKDGAVFVKYENFYTGIEAKKVKS